MATERVVQQFCAMLTLLLKDLQEGLLLQGWEESGGWKCGWKRASRVHASAIIGSVGGGLSTAGCG